MRFPMSMIRQLLFGAESMGASLNDLLPAVQLSEADLADSERRLPWKEGLRIWEAVLAATGDKAFGLHIGKNVTTSMAGLVGHMMERSKNLIEASRVLEHYLALAYEMFEVRSLMEGQKLVLSIQPIEVWRTHSPETARQAVDMSFASILHIVRLLTGRSFLPERVDFTSAPPKNIEEYKVIFGPELRFLQKENRMVFRESDGLAPVIGYNQEILNSLQQIAAAKLQELFKEPEMHVSVEKWIAEHWKKGFPQIGEVAKALHVSVRTLQRRLREEGTSFHRIVETSHQQLAQSLLQKTSLPVAEIAFMLGYADPQAFRKAFRRWTGTTPLEVRKS